MVRTHNRLGNNNGDRQPKPQRIVEHAPEVVPTPKLVTMAGDQAMI